MKELIIERNKNEVTLKVNSQEAEETPLFLLRDDKNRIYTFTENKVEYTRGENEYVLHIEQDFPEDIDHLNFVIFYSKPSTAVAGIYEVTEEYQLPIF